MSRRIAFLFTTWEGGGNVGPALAVATRLVRRAHDVRVMSDSANRGEATAAGAEFISWTSAPNRRDRSRDNDPLRDWEAATAQEGFSLALRKVMVGPALAYARDVLAELRRVPADLVVSSEILLGVMAACESRRQRLALFAANLCVFPLPGMPVFGPGLPPPRGDAERSLHAQIKTGAIEMFDASLDEFNAARRELGLRPLAHVTEQLDAATAYLLGTSRAFDFPADPPAAIRYVGPQLDDSAWTEPWSPPWPATDDRPLIVVAFSTTFQDHARALQAVIDVASTLPVRALVTLGGIDRTEIRPAGKVWLASSAPHDVLMREATLVVTHGGHGTVMRALIHGCPMLIMPHGRDQGENAVRVSERGAGIVLPADADSTQIAGALQRLLADDGYRRAARRLRDAIVAESAGVSVVTELEEVATPPPE